MLKSFEPVINKDTLQMIIGTMPGEASLKAKQYYAYKHNKFWQIMSDIFKNKEALTDYQDKLNTLLNNKTGLWDALAYCRRKGSLDKNIINEKPNDFKNLLKNYPKVKKLIFNGQQAHKYFLKYFGQIESIEYIILPSTSPANASKTYKQKAAVWKHTIFKNGKNFEKD